MTEPRVQRTSTYGLCLPREQDTGDFRAFLEHLAANLDEAPDDMVIGLVAVEEFDIDADTDPWTATVTTAS